MAVNGNLLNARQVAERLNVSIGWVMAHAEGRYQPVLPSIKIGRAVRFKADQIEAFLDYCQRQMEAGRPL